jgi:hypothetical protein
MSTMKISVAILCLVVGGGAALAQPTEPPQPAPQPQPDPTPSPSPVPAPTPMPTPVAPPTPMPAGEGDDVRPRDLSIGIGVGYQFPTSLETPNITSVRFRLPSGLTLEPQLVLATSKNTLDTGVSVDDKTTELGAGALARYPLVRRGRVDLELLGAANFDTITQNPEGDDDETTNTTLTVAYGVAVVSWITPHWNVSMSATNPLISYEHDKQEMGADTVTVNTTTTIGAVFDPTVFLMVHLHH